MTMPLSPLTALSPLDGRYHGRLAPLREAFSELALIRCRVLIEVEWLKALSREPAIAEVAPFSPATAGALDQLAAGFSEATARR
jgi:adenylosuccinate lyase